MAVMAKRRRQQGGRAIYVRIREDLGERLDRQLERSRRSLTAEVELALEAWLDRQEEEAKKESKR